MRSLRRMAALIAVVLFLGLPVRVTAWSFWEHRVVAEIAQQNLTPAAREGVKGLLGPDVTLSEVSTWADQVRRSRTETGPWHYVNWPLADEEPSREVIDSPPTNVIAAIEYLRGVLRDHSRPEEERREALKYLTHFVGDIHQPLHCGTGDDLGGNTVRVKWEGKSTNLHSVWDGSLFGTESNDHRFWARYLQRKITGPEREAIMQSTPYEWAIESHRIARDFCYPQLKEEQFIFIKNSLPELSGSYARAARPIVRRRILEGGLRLAALLNAVFAD